MLKRYVHTFAGLAALVMGIGVVSTSPGTTSAQGSDGNTQPPYPEVTLLLGNTQDRLIHSSIVDYGYRISVALPLSYYTNARETYPVLYVLDPHLSFGTVTDVVRVAAVGGELPELIVVGIGYSEDIVRTRALRERDYSRAPQPFLEFIRDELIPIIDTDYRTDPANRGIIGHSYGGDFVLYALFHAPGMFNRFLAGSPNFTSATALELAYAGEHSALEAQVLLTIGERDDAGSTQALMNSFVNTLESRDYEGLVLTTLVFPGATHFASRPLHHVSGVYAIYSLRQ